ncbi:UNVERIFIED_CONTAM: hypothetical protein Sangu_3168500, partial [Sesamum angustifolium]
TPWSALYPDSFHSGLASLRRKVSYREPPRSPKELSILSKPSGNVNSEIVSYQFTPDREFRSICTWPINLHRLWDRRKIGEPASAENQCAKAIGADRVHLIFYG